jgi:hypothetical protein
LLTPNPHPSPLPKGEGAAIRHPTPALSPVEVERETLFWFNALLIASNGTDK